MFGTLFGSEMPLPLKFFIAFAVVLALIGATAWLVRRFGASRLGVNTRGRQPRLAVIDAATVDGRRRLVLIRRDNVEHLLMIGGPTDVVVEPNIVRAVGAREVTREPARVTVSGDALSRSSPTAESLWPLQPASEPPPVSVQRPYRSTSVPDEPWITPEPPARAARAGADSLTGLAAELSARLNPSEMAPAAAARAEPVRVNAPAPAEPASPPQTDHNLAEMAQQLEAALRRAPSAEGRPPVTDPLAAPAVTSAPRTPEPPRQVVREPKVRIDPRIEPRMEPKLDSRLEPMSTPGKNLYDNLEQEMASLLGRPSGKS